MKREPVLEVLSLGQKTIISSNSSGTGLIHY
jgi:hypothetical protein